MTRTILAVTAALCLIGSNAEARPRHHHNHHHHHAGGHHRHHGGGRHHHTGGGHYAGRPAAWCGWYMRSQIGSDPGPSYNLARSWAHYGSNAGGPRIGAIVVWSHHVGKIVGPCEGSKCMVRSGNDNGAVRTRMRSVAGAVFRM